MLACMLVSMSVRSTQSSAEVSRQWSPGNLAHDIALVSIGDTQCILSHAYTVGVCRDAVPTSSQLLVFRPCEDALAAG